MSEIHYYASLVGPMLGFYYPLPIRRDAPMPANVAGALLNASGLSRLWCALYSTEKAKESAYRWGGSLLPAKCMRLLRDTFDAEEFARSMKQAYELNNMAWPPEGEHGWFDAWLYSGEEIDEIVRVQDGVFTHLQILTAGGGTVGEDS